MKLMTFDIALDKCDAPDVRGESLVQRQTVHHHGPLGPAFLGGYNDRRLIEILRAAFILWDCHRYSACTICYCGLSQNDIL